MTKPTVTTGETTMRYAVFRKDATIRTQDTALQGKIYSSIQEAKKALLDIQQALPSYMKSIVEVRNLDSSNYRDDQTFGTNPWVKLT